MISHFNKDSLHDSAVYLNLKFPLKPSGEDCQSPVLQEQRETVSEGNDHSQDRNEAIKSIGSNYYDCQDFQPGDGAAGSSKHGPMGFNESESQAFLKQCSCSASGSKKRTWETSYTSVKSKKIKGGHQTDCDLHAKNNSLESDVGISFSAVSKRKCKTDINPSDRLTSRSLEKNAEEATTVNLTYKGHSSPGISSRGTNYRIMLMNIADDNKKENLTKIIGDLGGNVTSDGSVSTHVVTGKVRKTLNFCSALCSGAWILSPNWLKGSFRNGKFIDEMPFILRDEDYELKYRTELKGAVLRAKTYPQSLFKGYDICLAAHVHPPVGTLSAIVKSAGGNVIHGLHQVKDDSKTIFVACEEDMDEALSAVKKGIWTFSSDWFMNCIMKQELDLGAPQFAESL
ncbi:BRCT-containing protein 1-like isoform X1 [Nicotiana tomentosiformis]|uniref:BRCT-containing protein 1-like isoform X1 n=1 Tax=Nicotiana tomentosiformis TaxID=4098 RepID=UPI00051B8529|nr:microcephalin-like isoform X1 [Nicotiana tomentosiformis]